MNPLRASWARRVSSRAAIGVVVGGAILYALVMVWRATELSPQEFFKSGGRFAEFFSRLTPPDWSVRERVIESSIETLMIAIAGTALAFLVSLPLGFLAASNVTPWWISQPIKWVLGFIRSIPLIVVALVFVTAVGLGPLPGMLAIAFHSIGMLGKFYAEEFETADKGILEAVSGTGANWIQTLRYGLFPQCVPQVITFTIYRLEMNFRDAAVLGIVGAGGIGYYIQLYIRGFQYEKVAVLLLVIIVMVTLLDQLSFWARRWVR